MRLTTLLVLLFACTGDKPPGSGDPSGGGEGGGEGEGEPECADDDACGDGEICEGETCVDGDRNNSVAEAEAIVWESVASGVINPAEDVDYFTFLAEGGEFVRISTALTVDRDEADTRGWDTALTLRDPTGKVLARVNDYPTGVRVSSGDAVLYAYLPQSGTYSIEVEDIGTWTGSGEAIGDPDYGYTLTLSETGSHTRESDSLESPSYDLDVSGAGTLYPVGVALEAADDSDWAELSFPYGEAGVVVYGMADMGGSDATPTVRLYDRDGALLLDKEGVGTDGVAYYPGLREDTYTIELTDALGGGGEDYWFFVFLIAQDEGDAYPEEEEPNDDTTTATELAQYLAESDDGDYTYAFMWGDLELAGDQDWYLLEGMEDGWLTVCLNSAVYGSTVAPTIEVYDGEGALQATVEGDPGADDGNTVLENLSVAEADYALVVRAPDEETGGLDAWYMMTVFTSTFEVGSYGCP